MDTFNVRIVYRVIDIEPGTGSQRLVVNKQSILLSGTTPMVFVEATKLLHRLTNQKHGVTRQNLTTLCSLRITNFAVAARAF